MKISLALVFLLFANQIFAQYTVIDYLRVENKVSITLDLESVSLSSFFDSDEEKRMRYFDESQPGTPSLPHKIVFVAIPANSQPKINYEVIKKIDLNIKPSLNPEVFKLNDSTLIYNFPGEAQRFIKNNDIVEVIGYGFIKNIYTIQIKINQYQLSNSGTSVSELKKLKIELELDQNTPSFNQNRNVKIYPELKNYILNYDDGINFAVEKLPSIPNDTTFNWINTSLDYVKMGVGKDGIYRVYGSDIQALGINISSINPQNIKLFHKGNEIPIYIKSTSDLVFGVNDYLEFPGSLNYTPDSLYRMPSGENDYYWDYFDKYSDTTVYWLAFSDQPGSRTNLLNGGEGSPLETLDYHTSKFHYEVNAWFINPSPNLAKIEQPFYLGTKSWVWDGYGISNRTYRNLTATDIVPNKLFKFSAKVVSAFLTPEVNSHNLSLAIFNSTNTRDSILIPRYGADVLTGTESTNNLAEGLNTVYVRNHANGASGNVCYTDWIDASYPRFNNLRYGNLKLHFDDLTSTNFRKIQFTSNSTDSVIVWRLTSNPTKIIPVNNPGDIYFNDLISSTSVYYVSKDSSVLKPVFYYSKRFKNLRDGANQADYLILTHKFLMDGAVAYASSTTQETGLTVKIIDVDDIYDEFNYGFFSPEPIREFLRITHSNWQSPLPEYLLLLGSANYDYQFGKRKANPAISVKLNLVPSYGAPVSDVFYSVWDTSGVYFPQLQTGRIPAKNNAEIFHYINKMNQYRNERFDDFNKSIILFSGGLSNDAGQIQQFKNAHNNIENQILKVPPFLFDTKHFYKTTNPPSNFGDVSFEEFNERIQRGGVFISYIGHSGTQTWDNSITDILQLRNSRNKSSLITDFGCSTTRFAEPDFTSFGELFVTSQSGQALGYIGNSSVGFSSTAISAPGEFYKTVLNDSITNISKALNLSKMKLVQSLGYSDVTKLFVLCNSLIGDPALDLKIPYKPNLNVKSNEIQISHFPVSNTLDSVKITFNVNNYGTIITNPLKISIKNTNNQSTILDMVVTITINNFIESISFFVPVRNYLGEHNITIEINSDKSVDEYYYDDNVANYSFFVSNAAVNNPLKYNNQTMVDSLLVFVNPGVKPEEESLTILFSESEEFNNPVQRIVPFTQFFTQLNLDFLETGKRYRMRIKNFSDNTFSESRSFIKSQNSGYFLSDSVSFSELEKVNLSYINNGLNLISDTIPVFVMSAGGNDGFSAVISVRNVNYVLENTIPGHHVGIFNSENWEFKSIHYFNMAASGPTSTDSYKNLIDSLLDTDIIIIAVSDNGRITDAQLTSRIKSLGSTKVDSMNGSFRSSWAMIGRKGAEPGSILEGFSLPFNGRVTLEDTVFNYANSGSLLTGAIGPVNSWGEINIQKNEAIPGQIKATLFGSNNPTGSFEDLGEIDISSGTNNLNLLNQRGFSYSKIKLDMNKGASNILPVISSVAVSYREMPDIGLNYQSFPVIDDTIKIKADFSIPFTVSNGGMSAATNFRVIAELRDPNDSVTVVFNQDNITLNAYSRRDFVVNGKAGNKRGDYTLTFRVDPDNRVRESSKDNNNYSLRFFADNDSIAPEIRLTIDGNEILSGDFISATPVIKVELFDDTDLSISDTTALRLRLNEVPVFFNSSEITYTFNQSNPKMVVEYKPKLSDGEYFLRVSGVNAFGIPADTTGLNKYFSVMNEPRILNVYNYPNPFKDDTYFTFRLSQIPDELKINIYTVAGRKIRTIDVPVNGISYDFNKIYWDGRDEDGDQLANGVYFYRVIMKKGDKVERITEKLAIVR